MSTLVRINADGTANNEPLTDVEQFAVSYGWAELSNRALALGFVMGDSVVSLKRETGEYQVWPVFVWQDTLIDFDVDPPAGTLVTWKGSRKYVRERRDVMALHYWYPTFKMEKVGDGDFVKYTVQGAELEIKIPQLILTIGADVMAQGRAAIHALPL